MFDVSRPHRLPSTPYHLLTYSLYFKTSNEDYWDILRVLNINKNLCDFNGSVINLEVSDNLHITMSERLEAGQQLVKKTMDQVIQEKQTTGAVSIQARQEFRESYQESYEEEFEEETFIDQHGNKTTKRVESSSESKEHSKSADVRQPIKSCFNRMRVR
ncbi:unnamed protein product [Leptosia nina]|uniref:Uncharacterized protein n=1 Tax=Leptosia nina TaxID=320188 RepID=A0AAV1JW58_9NEOP